MKVTTKIVTILLAVIFAQGCSDTNKHDATWYYNESMNAYGQQDYQSFLKYTKKASKLMPGRLTIRYNLACAYSLTGKIDAAYRTIYELIEKGLPPHIENDSDFDNIRGDQRYPDLLDRLARARTPINNSTLAFRIPEVDLIPEGLAYDSDEDCFYIGSIYKSKIVKITRDGTVSDFTRSRQDQLVSIIGMKVDPELRTLWASSSYGYKKDNIPFDKLGTCEMVKYNLVTGELLERYALPQEENHFFNDLVITDQHDAFITDSHVPAVCFIDSKSNELRKYIDLPEGSYPNGITISDDQNFLYVALTNRIMIVDLHDRTNRQLKHPENAYIGGCDGLYYYQNSLIGIQSFLSRVARFHLNADLDEVTEIEVLEAYNPKFENPTTGAIANQEFYYIANAQLGKIDREGNLAPKNQLTPVTILKLELE